MLTQLIRIPELPLSPDLQPTQRCAMYTFIHSCEPGIGHTIKCEYVNCSRKAYTILSKRYLPTCVHAYNSHLLRHCCLSSNKCNITVLYHSKHKNIFLLHNIQRGQYSFYAMKQVMGVNIYQKYISNLLPPAEKYELYTTPFVHQNIALILNSLKLKNSQKSSFK
eukprot:XP_002257832.1 hypothetical protein PKH_021580 [Plasmodium knowlesi strain H]